MTILDPKTGQLVTIDLSPRPRPKPKDARPVAPKEQTGGQPGQDRSK
jgi:hypothetical protein